VALVTAGVVGVNDLHDSIQEFGDKLNNYGISMQKELGDPDYRKAMAQIAHHDSPQKLAWMEGKGPASRSAYNAYLESYDSAF
jgi:phosphopantetheinyl transferase